MPHSIPIDVTYHPNLKLSNRIWCNLFFFSICIEKKNRLLVLYVQDKLIAYYYECLRQSYCTLIIKHNILKYFIVIYEPGQDINKVGSLCSPLLYSLFSTQRLLFELTLWLMPGRGSQINFGLPFVWETDINITD